MAPSAPLTARERYAGLLEAALAADSLTLAAHWIYDQAEIAREIGRVTDLQSAPEDSYHPGKDRGAQTHYGDQTLVLLDSLNNCGGNFVMEDFARRWRQFWASAPSYRDSATKETLARLDAGNSLLKAGSSSTELGGAARIAPLLVALRQEEPATIIAAARAQTALTHATPLAMDSAEFIARTVFLLMRGVTIHSALPMAATLPYRALPAEVYLRQADAGRDLPTDKALARIGLSCGIEKALPAVFALLLRHGDDPETALIENVMAGGDSAARGMVLGVILGAAHGRRAIPARWSEALLARSQVDDFLTTVGVGTVS